MRIIFLIAAVFSILALATITIFLFASGLPFIFGYGPINFLFGAEWHPDSGAYGILSMILGTLYVTALATLIGVSIGLFTAICLYKFTPKKLVGTIRQMVNLLAGIPSVVYGLFGIMIVVPFLRDYISPNNVGYGIMAASIILAIMILPTVISISLDSLRAVPRNFYEGALALGATREQAVFRVVVPSAKSGIFAGVVLAVGRALGETMAVIMVIGNGPEIPNSLFQTVNTMTSNIAFGALEATGDKMSALVATGVVLFVFTLLLNISFNLLKKEKTDKVNRKKKEAADGKVLKT